MQLKFYYDGDCHSMTPEQIHIVEEFIESIPYMVIGTTNEEGIIHLSTLNNLPGQTIQTIYFATGLRSQKVRNILGNPACEILFQASDGQLIVSGYADIVTDPWICNSKWQPDMNQFFRQGKEDEDYCIVSVTAHNWRGIIK